VSNSPYIELLKKSLIDYHSIGGEQLYSLNQVSPSWKIRCLQVIDRILRKRNFGLFKIKMTSEFKRLNGQDWPPQARTMVGLKRLNNVEFCIESILSDDIEGDFVETGVWRGGVIILMKAILDENKVGSRMIWAFDSFKGLPRPDFKKYPEDRGNKLHKEKILQVSLEEVKSNFKIFDINLDGINFIKGWFKNTLPHNKVKNISLLRLDGDLYESTKLALDNLYFKVSKGGYVIIDDYNAFHFCKKAVDDFRMDNGISEPLVSIDLEAVYWRKS